MKPLRLLLFVLALCWAPAAHALCVSGLCSCTMSTTGVAFGSYNPLTASNIDTVGSVTVKCGGVAGLLIPYTVDIGTGAGTYAQRQMSSGGNRLNYNLYLDSTRSTVWGDGTGGSGHVSSGVTLDVLGLSPGNVHTVYGRLPALQTTAVPGGYTDTITVTVTYQ